MRKFPHIYAQAQGLQARGHGQIYQAKPKCPCYKQYTQQSYLAKTDLHSSVFLCENPVFKSVRIRMGCDDHHDPDGHKDMIFMEKYGAVQVCFCKIVLL